MGQNPLINVGDLAKPINTLIEKISDAIGGYYKPFQITRVAQAETDAEKIRAVGQVEVTEIQRRAMTRFFAEEGRKQANIESITRKALPDVSPGAEPERMDNDWIVNFLDRCRLTSDDQMQELWARVLAGEANSPGRFSKRTVNLVASLDKNDAVMFTNLCAFIFSIGSSPRLLIYDVDHPLYTSNGANFGTLAHLESIGLLHFNNVVDYQQRAILNSEFVKYFNTAIGITFPNGTGNNTLVLGRVILTQAGSELASICKPQPVAGFIEYVVERWRNSGIHVVFTWEQSQGVQDVPSGGTPR